MGRTGKKKIIYIAAIMICAALFIAVGVWINTYHIIDNRQLQLTALLDAYPELETEIVEIYMKNSDSASLNDTQKQELQVKFQELSEKYGYHEWQLFQDTNIIELFLYCIFITSAAILLVRYVEKQSNQKLEKYHKEQLNHLLDTISSMQKGNYDLPANTIAIDEHNAIEEKWWLVREMLYELAQHLSGQKMLYENEEYNTKTLITDISHQLKTPLASLRMSHELVLSSELSKKEQKEFLLQESVEIHKLELLLEELVKISRLENHMIEVVPKTQEIHGLITDAVGQVYGKAKSCKVEIVVEMNEKITARYDRKWTTEALSNVLDNAIKYSKPEQKVVLRVSKLAQNVLIEVEDDGIGISSEEIHKIFKRFYRGMEASQYVKDGVGVGLYLARRILEQQGGTITAKRKMTNGSIFQIILPLADNQ